MTAKLPSPGRVRALQRRLYRLCAEHLSNSVANLPPDVLPEAIAIENEIGAIKRAISAASKLRVAAMRAGRQRQQAARLVRLRAMVAASGGTLASNKALLARQFGVSRTAIYRWLTLLAKQQSEPRCLTCQQLLLPPPPSTATEGAPEVNDAL